MNLAVLILLYAALAAVTAVADHSPLMACAAITSVIGAAVEHSRRRHSDH